MAPIEPDLHNSNLRPLLLFGSYFVSTFSLLYLILHRVLYQASTSLPPSQATRFRENQRQKHVRIFAGLSVISLAVACYYIFNFLTVSYRVWAHERGEALPLNLWGRGGLLGSDDPVDLQLGRWLKDTSLLMEWWEIAIERSRRFWWTQQLVLGTAAWSTFAAIEGRRRNIPYLWAFLALSMLVSLAVAQNLFFLAILLTPTPLADDDEHSPMIPRTRGSSKSSQVQNLGNMVQNAAAATESSLTRLRRRSSVVLNHYSPRKPPNWAPHPLILIFPLLTTSVLTILLPFASNTPSFPHFVTYTHLSLFLPLLLPRLTPARFGKVHPSASASKRAYVAAFRCIGIISLVLHLKQSLLALVDNEPGYYYHRHSLLYFHREAHRSRLERTRSAAGRVLGSIGDHPAIGAVGWEVLLCGLSCCIWAAVRALDAGIMLESVGRTSSSRAANAVDEMKSVLKGKAKDLVNGVGGAGAESKNVPTAATGKTRPRKKALGKRNTRSSQKVHDAEEDHDMAAYVSHASPPAGLSEGGEDVVKDDWDAAALAGGLWAIGGLGSGCAGVFGAEVAER